MNTKEILRYVMSVSVGLWLVPVSAGADFIIELRSGRQVTVERYQDDGQKIVIQTALGSIGFRKDDVKQITEVGDNQGLKAPLGEAMDRPATPTASEEQPVRRGATEAGAGESGKAAQDAETKKEMLSPAQITQVDQQFQQVNGSYKDLWAQHKQQLKAGASAVELAENRQRLLAFDKERQLMRKKILEEAKEEDFPDWIRR